MKSKHLSFLFTALVAVVLAFGAKAATRTWTGGGDGTTWSDGANWGGTAPGSSDGVSFPDNIDVSLTMPSAAFTCSGAFTLGANCSIRLNGSSKDVVCRFNGNVTIPESSLLTVSNCGLYFGNATASNYSLAGDVTITDGAAFQVAGGVVFKTTDLVIEKKSKLSFDRNITIQDSACITLDDSEILPSGSNKQIKLDGNAKIVFCGKSPYANIVVMGASSSSMGHLEFRIPAGGYDRIPFVSADGSEVPNNAKIYCSVSSDSPAYASNTDKVIPLIATSKGLGYANGVDKMGLDEITDASHPAGTEAQWAYLSTQLSDADVSQGTCSQLSDGWKSPYPKSGVSRYSILTLGVYIKGVPTDPIPPALDGTIATEAGADGKSFSATVTVSDLGMNFDIAEVTPQVILRYRVSGATEWIDAGAANVAATGAVRLDVMLPTAVNAETVFDVQAFSRVTVENVDFDSAPIAGSVTLEPAASDAPAFADDDPLVVKEVTSGSLTMTAILSGFGNGAALCALGLMIRESGESGDGAEVATANLTAADAVDLTASNLAPGTPYEVRVVATNDKAKTVATAWTAVSTLAVAPTLAATSVTDVGYETITVASGLDALGAKGVTVTLNLYLREGTSGNGAVVATSNVTAVGAVELTAGDLSPETSYQAQVVASYTLDETVRSAESAWIDFTTTAIPPQFASFAADGAAGDAIRAGGALKEVAGAVVVEISKAEDFASLCDSFDAGEIAAEGAFAHTFQTVDTTAANYIAPGETYYVRAVATKGGLTTVSDVIAVTTAAGSTAVVTTFTHTSSNVTIVGTLDPKGAGTTEVHILWCEDGIAYDRDVKVATIGPDDDPAWEWSTTLENEEILFCYKIYATNSCAGASWQTDPVLGKDTDLPYDTSAKYMWVADANGCFDGAWTDRAHWKPVKADGSDYHGFRVDYPDQDAKNVKPFDFSAVEGTNAVVMLPATAVSWGTTDELPGAKNASITFKGTPGQTVVKFSDGDIKSMSYDGATLVLDGLSLTFPQDFNMTSYDQSFVVQNGAYVKFSTSDKSFRIAQSPNLPSGTVQTNSVVVDNATVDMSTMNQYGAFWLGENSKKGHVVNVILRGKHPLLKVATLVTTANTTPSIIFEIPEGGYAETPIVGGGGEKLFNERAGRSSTLLDLVVDRASYPLSTMTGRKRTYTLIDWSKGFNTSAVSLDDGSGLKKTRELDMYYALADGAKVSDVNLGDATKVKAFVKSSDGLVITVTGAR